MSRVNSQTLAFLSPLLAQLRQIEHLQETNPDSATFHQHYPGIKSTDGVVHFHNPSAIKPASARVGMGARADFGDHTDFYIPIRESAETIAPPDQQTVLDKVWSLIRDNQQRRQQAKTSRSNQQ
ncbi:MAG: hypothetical protein SFZ03_08235 [Candidatus Melainabacteria bacterium]|nr:hypothetical protein [Candidatus Melainabacteria bacterium]